MARLLRSALFIAGAAVVGCGSDVIVQRAPGYAPRSVTLSVLGVFKNGRMDAAAWNDWEQTVRAATGSATCVAGFDDRMEKAVPALFTELDDSTRQDGITDEILDRVAPNAQGGAILVVQVFGTPPQVKKQNGDEAPSQQPAPPQPQPGGRGRGRGRMRSAAPAAAPSAPPRNALDVSIGVYSIRDHQLEATVQLHSDGGASADALHELSEKLRETLRGAKCAGWAWQNTGNAG